MRMFIAIANAIVLVLPALAAAQATQAKPDPPKTEAKAPASIAGKWNLSLDVGGNTVDVAVEFKQEGKKITGTVVGPDGNPGTLEGEFADGKLKFTVSAPDGNQIPFAATAKDDNTMTGSIDFNGQQLSFTLTRLKG